MTSKETPKRSLIALAENSLDLVARYCSDMDRQYPTRISYSRVGEALTNLDKFIKKHNREQPQPTLKECIKEWEEKGFEVENNDKSISFRNTKLNIDIYVDKLSKEIQICVCHYNYAQTISFEFHNLLSKTLKVCEVENDKMS